MEEIRYIHAADLHLDAPFQGISRETAQGAQLKNMLREATFAALDNLVVLCEREKPDFLVLAGDIYNQEECGIRAQLELRRACRRLEKAGVRVFIVHGNHDPLSSRFSQMDWPKNVFIFGPDIQRVPLEKNGEVAALVQGLSHSGPQVAENLALRFERDPDSDAFQLGILHCSVDGDQKTDRYAPCSLEDLKKSGLDAWALGHAHWPRVLCEEPFIAYPGSAQGLNIKETGPRGCFMVKAARGEDGWKCEKEFAPLAPVLWEKATLDLENVEGIDAVEQKLGDLLDEYRNRADASTTGAIFRIRLEGRTALDAMLRKEEVQRELIRFMGHQAYGQPAIWIRDFEVETSPARSRDEYLRRDDILGETARVAKKLLEDGDERAEMLKTALEPLFAHIHLKKVLPAPDQEQTRKIIVQAESLCQDLLEKR